MAGYQSCILQFFLIIFIASAPVFTAPYLNEVIEQQQQTQQQIPLDDFFQPSQGLIGPLYRENDHALVPPSRGVCHYQLRYYAEGERIDTKEPCLNCTCNNSMLMCYLKVCPFSKPIGKDCTVEKSPDQCCPVITCPQVPVNLQVMHMTSTTSTSAPVSSSTSEIVSYTEHGCSIEGQYYPDGAQVPGDHRKPCELCYCIRNHTACIMQECILKVEGCEPVFVDGICCPVRYKCAHDKEMEQITTTTVAPNGTLITTTIQPPSDGDCYHNNEFYTDGELIQSENPCEHCYCMNSDVVCAIQECRSPLDEEDENCIPRTPPPGQCCPEAYDCPEAPEHTTLKYEPSVTEVVSPEVPEEKLPVTPLAPETTEREELITKDIITDTTDTPVKEVTIKDIELETTPVTLTEDVEAPDEGIQIDTTITPVVDEEKETIIETTLSPVAEEESDLDSTFDIPLEEEVEPTLDTTFGPSIEDEKEPSVDTTLAPVSIDEEEPSLYTTSAPVDEVETEVSVDTTLSPATAEEKEPSLKPTLAPVTEIEKEPPIDFTVSPVAEDEEPSIDSTLSPKIQDKETVKETTLATAIEDEKEPITDTTIEPLDEEEEPPVETTLSPEIEEEPVIDATSVPVTEEEKPSVDTTISPAPEKEEPTVDTTLSPEIEEPAIDVTMVPVDEEIEFDVDTTVSPTPEEKEPSIETTIAPVTEEKEPSIDTTSPPAIPETEAPGVPLEEEKEPIEPIATAPVTDVDEVTFEVDAIDTTISPVDEEKEIPDHTGIDIIPVTTSIPEETDDTVTETFETDPFMLETRTSGLSPTTKPMVDDSELTTLKSVDDETIPEEIQPSLDITTVPSKLDTTEYEADKVSPESQTEIIQETTPETDAYPEEIPSEKDEHLAVEPEVPEILLTTEPPREDVTSIIVDETTTGKPEIQERTTLLDKVDEQDTTVEVLVSTDPSILPEEETEKAIIEDEAETETEYPKVDITTDEYEIKTTVKPLDIDESKYEVPDKPLVVTAVPEDVVDITTQVQLEETSEIYHDITAQPELSSPETTEILEEKEPTKTVSPSGLEEILTSSVRPQVTEDVITLEPSTEEDKVYEEITPTYEGVTSPEVDISPVSTDSPTKLETTPSTEKERVTTPKETIEDKEDEITVPEIETEPPVLISDGSCDVNGTIYSNGDDVPVLNNCQEKCMCRDTVVTCQFKACPSAPPAFLRCNPVEVSDDCCPQYKCEEFQTELEAKPSPNCFRNGTQYYDGDYVPSKDICTDCYCLYGEIVCAYIECPKYGEGCKPIEIPEGKCCPSKYECPELEVGDMTMDKEDGATTVVGVETTTPLLETLPSELPETSTVTDEKPLPVEEEQDITVTTSLPLEEERETTVSVSLPSEEEEEIATESIPSEKEQITTLSTPVKEQTPEEPVVTEAEKIEEVSTTEPEVPPTTPEISAIPETELPSEEEPVSPTTTPSEEVTLEEETVTEKTEEISTTEPEVITKIPEEPKVPQEEDGVLVSTPETIIEDTETTLLPETISKDTVEDISEPEKTAEPTAELVTTEPTVIEKEEISTDKTEIIKETTASPDISPDVEVTTEEETATDILSTTDSAKDITESHITSTMKPHVVVDELTTIKEIDIFTTLKPDIEISDTTTKISKEPELGTEDSDIFATTPDVLETTKSSSVPSEDIETTPSSIFPYEVTETLEKETPSIELETTSVKDLEIATTRPEELEELPVTTSASPLEEEKIIEDKVTETAPTDLEVTSTLKPSPSPVDITVFPLATTVSPSEEDITEKIEEITDMLVTVDTELDVTTFSTITDEETSSEEPLIPETEEATSEVPIKPDEDITTIPSVSPYETSTPEKEIETDVSVEPKTTEEPYPLTTSEDSILPDAVTTDESIIPGEGNCLVNGTEYGNGENVPKSSPCQENCKCKDSVVTCQLIACPAPPPAFFRCEVEEQASDSCCPSYQCPVVDTDKEPSPKCIRNGTQYYEGDLVPSQDICTDCYCLYEEIVCATLECPPIPQSCIRAEVDPGVCCPTKYECPEIQPEDHTAIITTEIDTSELDSSTVETVTEKEFEKEVLTETTLAPETEYTTGKQDVPTTKDYSISFEEIETDPQVTTSTHIPIQEEQVDTSDAILTTTDKLSDIPTVSPVETGEKETISSQPEVVTDTHTEADVTEPSEIEIDTTTHISDPYSPETQTISSIDFATGKYTTELEDVTLDTTDRIIDETTIGKTTEQTIIPDKETSPSVLTTLGTEEPAIVSTEFVSEKLTERPIEETTTEYLVDKTTAEYTVEDTTLSEKIDVQDLTEVQEKEQYKKCSWHNKVYEHGTSVEPDNECQDFCKCENGTVKCKHRACEKVPPSFLRCAAVTSNDTCCPVYDCGEPEPTETFCEKDGKRYNNSDYVPSGTECLDCYCLEGEIVCASLECGVPRSGCTALVQRNSDCCPILYECDESPMETEEFMIDVDEELANVTTALIPDTDVTVVDDTVITTSTKLPSVAISSTPLSTTEKSLTTVEDDDDVEVATVKLPVAEEEVLLTTEDGLKYSISTVEEGQTTVLPVKVDKEELLPEDKETTIIESLPATTTATEKVTDRAPISEPEITEAPETEISEEPEISTEKGKVTDRVPDSEITETPETEISEEPEISTEKVKVTDRVPVSDITETPETEISEEPEKVTDRVPVSEITETPETEISEEPEISTEKVTVTDRVPVSEITETPETEISEEPEISTEKVTEPTKEVDLVSVPEKDIATTQTIIDLVHETTKHFVSEEAIAELSTEPAIISSTINATAYPELKEPVTDDKPDITSLKVPEDDVPKETIPEGPFPAFPPYVGEEEEGDYGQTYLPPHLEKESTTWKPTTTTELVVGPGNCVFDSKVYVSAEQIPRDDPCDFCFCFRGDIICLAQTCPEPIYGCYEEAIPGFCCPRYECPVRQEFVNITTTTPSPFPGFPPSYKTSRIAMCEIEGKHYASGEVVKSASSPCHECICGSDGFMKCIPKECDTKRKIYKYGYR